MQTLTPWAINLYYFQWDDHSTHCCRLREICDQQQATGVSSGISENIKHNLYESRFDFAEIQDSAVESWCQWIKDCVFQAAAQANRGLWRAGDEMMVDIHESWCHVTQDRGYHDMHIHPRSSWSGIYYLDIGDMQPNTKNGVNRFYSPWSPMYTDAGSAWISQNTSIDVNAQPGMLIVFPSFLHHSAMPYQGSRPRYILSFNSRILRSQ